MSNDVTTTVHGTAPAVKMSQSALMARLANARDTMGGEFKAYLAFNGKKGTFSYKQDDEVIPVPMGTKMAVNFLGAKRGWQCWKDKSPVDEKAVDILDPLPPKSSLPDHGPYAPPAPNQQAEGWVEFVMLPMKNVETGKEFIFKVSSKSGIISVGALLTDVIAECEQGRDLEKDVVVVSLGVKSFTSGGHENEKPVFKIVDWKLGAMTPVIADGGATAAAATAALTQETNADAGEDATSIPKSRAKK